VCVCICVSDGCCFCLSVSCTRLGFEIGISTSAIPRIIVYRKCSLRIHGEKKKKNNPSRREKLARFFRGLVRKIYVFSAVHRFARNANLSSFIPLIKSPFSTPVSVSLPLSLAHMSGQINYAPFFFINVTLSIHLPTNCGRVGCRVGGQKVIAIKPRNKCTCQNYFDWDKGF